ncbi:MAG: hypothetical protein ACK5LL_06565 [Suipraeoptans sp.]
MSPELFNTFVDWFIGALGISVLVLIAFTLAMGFYDWIKEKCTHRKMIEEQHYQDLVESANRKIQVINRQIQSLDKCSKEIEGMTEILNKKTDSFLHTLQEKLLQYRETTAVLKDIDGNIQKSASVIKENPLLNSIEDLAGLLGKKADILMRTIEKNASNYQGTAILLKRIDANMRLSAASINESAVLLEKRDKDLQNEISILLSLEGKTDKEIDYLIHSYKAKSKNKFGLQFNQESELSFYLDYPIDILPIPMTAKNIFRNKFKCEYLEDVLSVMLLQQRKGLTYNIRNMGKKSIVELENYFCEIGLLTINNKHYTSDLIFNWGG